MAQPSPQERRVGARDGAHQRVEPEQLPIDPDVGPAQDAGHRPDGAAHPFAQRPRSRWPRIHWTSVGMVAVGGFFGGATRYAVGLALPTPPDAFPWATFAVNTAGAFILALLLVVVVELLPPTTYLRPAIGTGFCGALTTFSSVVVSVDELAAHGHAEVAAGYLVGSVLAGLAAAALGLVCGRSVAAYRAQGQE